MNALIKTTASVSLALVLVSCGGGSIPPDTFYRLSEPPSPAATQTLAGTVEVQPVRADGLLNDRAILYSDGDTVLRKYNYHFWSEPPSSLLQDYFVDRLRVSQTFEAVASPEMRVDRDYDLRSILKRFEHVTEGGPARVAIEIEVTLRRMRGGETLLLKTYAAEESASGSSVPRAVDAFSAAMDRIYTELQRDIEAIDM